MIADRRDFTESVAQKHTKAQQNMLPMARIIAGAAPVTDKLVRSEEWGRYVTYLQGITNRMAEARDAARDRMNAPAVLAHTDLLKLKFDAAEADAMVRAWTMAIELPAWILKGGAEADEFVKNYEKKNETPGQTA